MTHTGEPTFELEKEWIIASVRQIAGPRITDVSWGAGGKADADMRYHLLLDFGIERVPVLISRREMNDLSSPQGKRELENRLIELLGHEPWYIWIRSGTLRTVHTIPNSKGETISAVGFYPEGPGWIVTTVPGRIFRTRESALHYFHFNCDLDTGRPIL
jgi:hypothetical protein